MGKDLRKDVQNTLEYPYSTIGLISMKFKNQE